MECLTLKNRRIITRVEKYSTTKDIQLETLIGKIKERKEDFSFGKKQSITKLLSGDTV
uniref:Uncharacterized protein n=1 Tax=Solanum tuberosum TaxID=4113 RepID=M1CJW1_SOLTU